MLQKIKELLTLKQSLIRVALVLIGTVLIMIFIHYEFTPEKIGAAIVGTAGIIYGIFIYRVMPRLFKGWIFTGDVGISLMAVKFALEMTVAMFIGWACAIVDAANLVIKLIQFVTNKIADKSEIEHTIDEQ